MPGTGVGGGIQRPGETNRWVVMWLPHVGVDTGINDKSGQVAQRAARNKIFTSYNSTKVESGTEASNPGQTTPKKDITTEASNQINNHISNPKTSKGKIITSSNTSASKQSTNTRGQVPGITQESTKSTEL